MVDVNVGWEGLPNWIAATATLSALLFAWRAGHWAKQAAGSTRAQAEAAGEQVAAANAQVERAERGLTQAGKQFEQQLAVAQEELELTRKSNLEAVLPVIFATATPKSEVPEVNGTTSRRLLEIRRMMETDPRWLDYDPVRTRTAIEPNEQLQLRIRMLLTFENVSDEIAVVSVNGGILGGQLHSWDVENFIKPKCSRSTTWERQYRLEDLATPEQINDASNWNFNVEFCVRDLGSRIAQYLRFNADLRVFERDGTRLVLLPEPSNIWVQNVAEPVRLEYWKLIQPKAEGTGS